MASQECMTDHEFNQMFRNEERMWINMQWALARDNIALLLGQTVQKLTLSYIAAFGSGFGVDIGNVGFTGNLTVKLLGPQRTLLDAKYGVLARGGKLGTIQDTLPIGVGSSQFNQDELMLIRRLPRFGRALLKSDATLNVQLVKWQSMIIRTIVGLKAQHQYFVSAFKEFGPESDRLYENRDYSRVLKQPVRAPNGRPFVVTWKGFQEFVGRSHCLRSSSVIWLHSTMQLCLHLKLILTTTRHLNAICPMREHGCSVCHYILQSNSEYIRSDGVFLLPFVIYEWGIIDKFTQWLGTCHKFESDDIIGLVEKLLGSVALQRDVESFSYLKIMVLTQLLSSHSAKTRSGEFASTVYTLHQRISSKEQKKLSACNRF